MPSSQVTACMLAFVAGSSSVLQTAINNKLSKEGFEGGVVGLLAALINFVVGLIAVVVLNFIHRPDLNGFSTESAPWYAFLGGCCGVIYIACGIFVSQILGLALFYVLLLCGTLSASLVLDYFGILGLPQRRPTKLKAAALTLLLTGVIMVQDFSYDGEYSSGVRAVLCFVAFAAGIFLPVQSLLNKEMQRAVGTPFRAAIMSFGGGVLILGSLCIFVAVTFESTLWKSAPWWSYTGGILGSYFVIAGVIAVPILGPSWYYCIMVSSQLVTAFFFDTLGAISYDKKSVTVLRIVGMVLATFSVVVYSYPTKTVKPQQEADDKEEPLLDKNERSDQRKDGESSQEEFSV